MTVTLSVDHGVLNVTAGPGISGNGSNTLTIASATPAAVNAILSSLSYTGDPNFNGSDTLTVTTSDGSLSDTDTVAITVNAVNDDPVAGNDAASVTEGSNEVATGNVLVNDTDVDATQTVSVAGFAAGTPGSPPTGNAGATVSGTYGNLTLNADGSYSYVLGVTGAQQSAIETPAAARRATCSPTRRRTISAPSTTRTTTITFSGQAINDAPVTATDSFSVAENDPALVGNVLGNDFGCRWPEPGGHVLHGDRRRLRDDGRGRLDSARERRDLVDLQHGRRYADTGDELRLSDRWRHLAGPLHLSGERQRRAAADGG